MAARQRVSIVAANSKSKIVEKFVIENGIVMRDGSPIQNVVAERIVGLSDVGLPYRLLERFLEKALENPRKQVVDELYLFLESHNLPITEDGDFLAYLPVRSDYYDRSSKEFQNIVGAKRSMSSDAIGDDRESSLTEKNQVPSSPKSHRIVK